MCRSSEILYDKEHGTSMCADPVSYCMIQNTGQSIVRIPCIIKSAGWSLNTKQSEERPSFLRRPSDRNSAGVMCQSPRITVQQSVWQENL